MLLIGLAVGLTLVAGVIISILLFMLNRRRKAVYAHRFAINNRKMTFIFFVYICIFVCVCVRNEASILSNEVTDRSSVFNLQDSRVDVSVKDLMTGHLVLASQRSGGLKICFFFFVFQETQNGTEADFSFYNILYDPYAIMTSSDT